MALALRINLRSVLLRRKFLFFFFQAEDGIRDYKVTGVQTWLFRSILVPVGTALLFPASTSLVSQRSAKHELGLVMGAQQTFRGIVSIVGPVGATLAFEGLGHGVPFLLAAAIVAVAGLLAFRERREAPVAATA